MSERPPNEPREQMEKTGAPGDADRERRLAEALAQFLDQQASEKPTDIESFCGMHPDLEPELREEVETLEQVDLLTTVPSPPTAAVGPEDFPARLSGHRVLGEIGSGGMGRVLLAADERLGRKVAIKTLNRRYRDNPRVRERFMHEARAMAKLSHPHIIHIYNLGLPDEIPHFVMEHLEGAPLTEAARPLPLRQKVELMQKVVLAVEFLHQHHILHRDLKPANILVGSDLEPKLLDFGLALQVDDLGGRLTLAGEVMGTPAYFSPEQTHGDSSLDARSDVFSLGTILYEVLTGSLPFRGETFAEHTHKIRDLDPVLPRRLNPAIPRDLQNICLKALEKKPEDRYNSAREMAEDLERYLAGEEVLALPTSYSRMISGKMEQHLRELESWKHDQIVSDSEYDALRKAYGRLSEPEDAWIMQVRRLSLSQVSLYLGASVLVIGAALILLFRFMGLSGALAVLVVAAAAVATAYSGIRTWKSGSLRFAMAYLLAFCLLLPIAMLVAMGEYGLFSSFTRGRLDLELFSKFDSFKRTTNAQLWWALLLSLPAYYWLRRFTRSSVFSLVSAVMAALFSLATLLRMGALEWLDTDPGKVYFHMIPIALAFFLVGILLERFGRGGDSRYFYPIAVVFTLASLSGVALFHEPYAKWLESVAHWTRGQVEYLFIINAAIYLVLQAICERFRSPQLRLVAKSFRFVIPGHVMTSLLLLGMAASDLWHDSPANLAMRTEARTFEIILPIVACFFVFGSIPKQMKNFFVWGLLFLAIGAIRLQQDFFHDRAAWPIGLLLAGVLLMLAATKYPALRLAFSRWFIRKA